MQKLLVTGGYGFVGNETVRQALARGLAVTVLDNKNRVAPCIEDIAGVPHEECDLADGAAVAAALMRVKPDAVVHLGAIHYIPECNGDPPRTLRVNVEGTQNVLQAAAAAGCGHVVVASSGAVYSDSPDPLHEEYATEPVDVYGWSKLFAERLCRLTVEQTGMPVTAVRLFNVYGPRETNAHIIPEILGQLRSTDVLRLGNIAPKRDFIEVRDAAEGFLRLAASVPGGLRTVNLSGGESRSMEELIALIAELTGRPIRVETDPSRFRKADKLVQTADLTLLEATLGWRPTRPIPEGLADLLRFEGLA